MVSDKKEGKMGLEKIIEISHKIADPYIKSAEAWKFATKLLAILLVLSALANIYLCTREIEIVFDAKQNHKTIVNQKNG